jgi:hypothetical protein
MTSQGAVFVHENNGGKEYAVPNSAVYQDTSGGSPAPATRPPVIFVIT